MGNCFHSTKPVIEQGNSALARHAFRTCDLAVTLSNIQEVQFNCLEKLDAEHRKLDSEPNMRPTKRRNSLRKIASLSQRQNRLERMEKRVLQQLYAEQRAEKEVSMVHD